MPRTLDEILVHSDELAARFENYEPNPAAERSQAERPLLNAFAKA